MGPESELIPGFTDLALVGRGGFGAVYRARQDDMSRPVAIKILGNASLDDEVLRRFDRERKAMGALSQDPDIVTVYDSGTTREGAPYLVMEFMEGGSVGDRLAESGPLSEADAAAILIPICRAVQHAHDVGILHRDVKPDNILLTADGIPKLSDFGVASLVEGTATTSGAITATVEHAAPEVLAGEKPTAASDVYSLGSTLYTLLAGRSPHRVGANDSVVAILNHAATSSVSPVEGISVEMQSLLDGCLSRDPHERPTSPSELAATLASVLSGPEAGSVPSRTRVLSRASGAVLSAQRFSPDEAGDIVARAALLENQELQSVPSMSDDGLTYAELVSVAAEVGVPERAVAEVLRAAPPATGEPARSKRPVLVLLTIAALTALGFMATSLFESQSTGDGVATETTTGALSSSTTMTTQPAASTTTPTPTTLAAATTTSPQTTTTEAATTTTSPTTTTLPAARAPDEEATVMAVQSAIPVADDYEDWELVGVEQGDIITITVEGNLAKAVTLFDQYGVERADHPGASPSNAAQILNYQVPSAGTYTIRVTRTTSHGDGTYVLVVTSRGESGVIPIGSTVQSAIPVADDYEDWELVGVEQGDIITITVEGNLAKAVTLFDQYGVERADHPGASPSNAAQILNYQVPSAGTYTIRVTRTTSHGDGTYVLSVVSR